MSSSFFYSGLKTVADRDWGYYDYRVLLVGTGYTFDPAHANVGDITSELTNVSGSGYARKALANKSTVLSSSDHWLDLIANNLVYTAINAGTAALALVYLESYNDANRGLIAAVDFPNYTTDGSDWTLKWDGNTDISGAVLRLRRYV